MSTGIGVGIAGQVFQTKAGAGIAPDPSYSNLYSVLFDGVDESLDATVSPNIGTGDFTINVWLYKTDASGSGSQRIFSKQGGTGSDWQVFINNPGQMQWSSSLWNDASGVGLVPSLNTWEMWSYSVNQSGNTASWYLNGANPNTKDISGSTGDLGVGNNFTIGRHNSIYEFAGNMDEISFWNAALTEAELLDLYNSGAPTDLSKSTKSVNLINWFRMGDPSGPSSYPTIADAKGSISMTMTNMSSANITTNVPT